MPNKDFAFVTGATGLCRIRGGASASRGRIWRARARPPPFAPHKSRWSRRGDSLKATCATGAQSCRQPRARATYFMSPPITGCGRRIRTKSCGPMSREPASSWRRRRQPASERIVYTSSVATLKPRDDGEPADETKPLSESEAIGAYKRSKIAAERLVEGDDREGPPGGHRQSFDARSVRAIVGPRRPDA